MIELVSNKKNVNLTGSSGSVNLTQTGGGGGDYYIPSLENGYINFEASKPNMPEVEAIDIWNRVKIWGADDGLICPENPKYFDFSQIPDTVEADLGLEPDKLDLSCFEDRNVGASLLVLDEMVQFGYILSFYSIGDMFALVISLYNGSELVYLKAGGAYVDFTTDTEGWYFGDFTEPDTVRKATEEDIALFTGSFKALKIVDAGSMSLEAFQEAMGVEVENVLDEIINKIICFYLPTGYYRVPKIPAQSGESSSVNLDNYITKEIFIQENNKLSEAHSADITRLQEQITVVSNNIPKSVEGVEY